MAWRFELAVECGIDHKAVIGVKNHFDGLTFALDDGTNGRWMADYVSEDEDKRWWVTVLPIILEKALEWKDDPQLLAATGKQLYERLKSAPPFRFAIVGIETFQFNRAESLRDLLEHPALHGLVVNEELFDILGRPREFTTFSNGYFWLPSRYKYG